MLWFPKGIISEKWMSDFKELVRKNYWKVKDCYWYYSGLGESNNIYQIPLNLFTDFITKHSGIVDGEIVKIAESDT